jgi:hypothetical protein
MMDELMSIGKFEEIFAFVSNRKPVLEWVQSLSEVASLIPILWRTRVDAV